MLKKLSIVAIVTLSFTVTFLTANALSGGVRLTFGNFFRTVDEYLSNPYPYIHIKNYKTKEYGEVAASISRSKSSTQYTLLWRAQRSLQGVAEVGIKYPYSGEGTYRATFVANQGTIDIQYNLFSVN